MVTRQPPRLRPERLIAAGRVVLAVFSLFAVWLDPTEPASHAGIAYSLLVAYVAYAAIVCSVVWRTAGVSRRWPAVTHAADLVFFSLFIFFTTGPGSPFTVYFVFALVCGTLRWQTRGTLITAVVTLTVFLLFGLYFGLVAPSPDFDLRAFIIRGVYLFVIAVLLGYVGVHEQRLLGEMRLLASWPRATSEDPESMLRNLLSHARPLLGASQAVLAWTEPDSPWMWVASWRPDESALTREPAGSLLLPNAIADRAYISINDGHPRTLIQTDSKSLGLVPWAGEPPAAAFLNQFGARTVLSCPVVGDTFRGRLFVLDKPDVERDDLTIAEIMAGVIAGRLDGILRQRQLQVASATEERIRLARDLHDGVLQSFTAVALRLEAIRTMLALGRDDAPAELESLQHVLASEQRELRFLIQELQPAASTQAGIRLVDRLDALADRIEREWEMAVDLRVDLPSPPADRVSREVYLLVREGLMNSARHGCATTATVRLAGAANAALTLAISDDGHGFPFTGRYSAEDLVRMNVGPRTLRERVRALNGTLTLDSGPTGSSLRIELPQLRA
jgi:signal transduction histidine kinase